MSAGVAATAVAKRRAKIIGVALRNVVVATIAASVAPATKVVIVVRHRRRRVVRIVVRSEARRAPARRSAMNDVVVRPRLRDVVPIVVRRAMLVRRNVMNVPVAMIVAIAVARHRRRLAVAAQAAARRLVLAVSGAAALVLPRDRWPIAVRVAMLVRRNVMNAPAVMIIGAIAVARRRRLAVAAQAAARRLVLAVSGAAALVLPRDRWPIVVRVAMLVRRSVMLVRSAMLVRRNVTNVLAVMIIAAIAVARRPPAIAFLEIARLRVRWPIVVRVVMLARHNAMLARRSATNVVARRRSNAVLAAVVPVSAPAASVLRRAAIAMTIVIATANVVRLPAARLAANRKWNGPPCDCTADGLRMIAAKRA